MIKLKELLKEWNDTSFRDLPKRWSKPVMTFNEPDGLTEFERLGGKDNISVDEAMSDEKKTFLMLCKSCNMIKFIWTQKIVLQRISHVHYIMSTVIYQG